jgi:hypothetical protein
MIAYQIGYLPVLLVLGGGTLASAFVIRRFGSEAVANGVTATGLLLAFYIIWFFVMILGYISGFRTGSAYADGTPIREGIRKDFFVAAYLRRKAHKPSK